MFIKIVDKKNEAEDVLNFVGSNLFNGERLNRYIKIRMDGFCDLEIIDEKYLYKNPYKNTKIFAALDDDLNLIGGMTLKFYLWEKLRKQYFFKIDSDHNQNKTLISVEHIENIVKNNFHEIDINDIKVSIELDSFAVKSELRGKGVGKMLLEKFVEEAKNSPLSSIFAFTIILGKYSKLKIGEFFMKYFFNGNTNLPKQKLPLKETLKILNLPYDIFKVNEGSYGTLILSKKFNFKFLGFGKYLGETWGYVFKD